MPLDRSSHGWSPPDRAPRLRRAADLLMLRAETSSNPARARRLARDMRIRAAKLELGAHDTDKLETALVLLSVPSRIKL